MPPKLADPKLYHLEPKGFWKTVHSKLSANPRISSGLPLPLIYRNPPPGSREEPYASPATAASDVAFNPYWKRDSRRAYPRTSVITQTDLTQLLLASPEGQSALPSPGSSSDASSDPSKTILALTESGELPSYSTVLAQVAERAPVFSASKLPPAPPSFGTALKPRMTKRVEDAPHNVGEYMHMYA